MKSRQGGLALLTVLFTVALLTLLVAQLQARFQIDVSRTTWLLREAQAREYALAAEQLARQILWEERQALLQAGAGRSPMPFPMRRFQLHHGEIHLDIIDLQGRVNINNLGDANLQHMVTGYLRNFTGMATLEPLIRDWLDQDSIPRPGGGEDSHYEVLPEPFKAANQALADPSEIIAVIGPLAPHQSEQLSTLVALPKSTPLNINSIAPELVTLIEPALSPAQFGAVRDTAGGFFEGVDDFLQSTVTAGINIDSGIITVNSQYYSIRASARVDELWYHLVSRIYQKPDTGRIELLDRQTVFSAPFAITPMEDRDGDHADRIF